MEIEGDCRRDGFALGEICRVHRDRASWQDSLSLTLDCSEDAPWPLESGAGEPRPVHFTFAEEPSAT